MINLGKFLLRSSLIVISIMILSPSVRSEGDIYWYNGDNHKIPPRIPQKNNIQSDSLYKTYRGNPYVVEHKSTVEENEVNRGSSNALAPRANYYNDNRDLSTGWEFSAGYGHRTGNFEFLTDAPSLLTWDDIRYSEFNISGRKDFILGKDLDLYVELDYTIGSSRGGGMGTDDDLKEPPGTFIISRGPIDSDLSRSKISLGFDKLIHINYTSYLTPFIGYEVFNPHFYMSVPFQYSGDASLNLPLSGITHNYETEWKGFFTGLDFRHHLNEKSVISFYGQYGLMNYKGIGIWPYSGNLNNDLSFIDTGRGSMYLLKGQFEHKMTKHWGFKISTAVDKYKVEDADVTEFFKNGDVKYIPNALIYSEFDSFVSKIEFTYSF
ncbi:MAG: hypothetical protein JJV93_03190 [Alphaproteobacteria bacterium]|nr:hypothetical protein [Alphaproteobacteria bacterium]MBL0718233.1 hypothetical protein [Alphaproteobacteria bacterium]